MHPKNLKIYQPNLGVTRLGNLFRFKSTKPEVTIYRGPIDRTMIGFKYIGNSFLLVSTFSAPYIYLYGQKPISGALLVLACGLLPSIYVYLQTNPYVTKLTINNKASPNSTVENLPKDTVLSFHTIDSLGLPALQKVPFNNLRKVSKTISPANLIATDTLDSTGKKTGKGKLLFLDGKHFCGTGFNKSLWDYWHKDTTK